MFRCLLLLSSALSIFGVTFTTAFAVRANELKPPADAASYDWTGLYIGLIGGYGMAVFPIRSDFDNPTSSRRALTENGGEGAFGGLYGGANWQRGRLVLGLEGEFLFSDLTYRIAFSDSFTGPDSRDVDAEIRERWSTAIRGRLGYLATDDLLLYGTLGWSWGTFDYRDFVSGVTGGEPVDGNDRPLIQSGLQVGGGLEARLTRSLRVKTDVAYSFYGEREIVHFFDGTFSYAAAPDTLVARIGLAASTSPFQSSRAPSADLNSTPLDWSGVYVGLQGGVGMALLERVDGSNFNNSNGSPSQTRRLDERGAQGLYGGVYAGLNWQVSRFLLGIEGDIGAANVSGRRRIATTGEDFGTVNFDVAFTHDWAAAVRGRLGVLPLENVLLYGTLGWGWGEFDYSDYERSDGPGNGPVIVHDGVQIGGGIEGRVNHHIGLRADIAYTMYDEREVFGLRTVEDDFITEQSVTIKPSTLFGRLGFSLSY